MGLVLVSCGHDPDEPVMPVPAKGFSFAVNVVCYDDLLKYTIPFVTITTNNDTIFHEKIAETDWTNQPGGTSTSGNTTTIKVKKEWEREFKCEGWGKTVTAALSFKKREDAVYPQGWYACDFSRKIQIKSVYSFEGDNTVDSSKGSNVPNTTDLYTGIGLENRIHTITDSVIISKIEISSNGIVTRLVN